ncbi:MAG: hemerythrin domain-containing protein [Pikeienuella sp.]
MPPPATIDFDHASDYADVARRFEACIDRQFALCLALESLADSLPARMDTYEAIRLLEKLNATLRQIHRFEETMVFPVLMISARDLRETLERLRTEHLEDEDQAADIRDALETYVTHRGGAPDEIGYMLRGLFTAMRRHLAFDRDQILPQYRRSCGL